MSPDEIRTRCDRLKKLFSTAPVKKTFGLNLEYDDEGNAIFTMPYREAFDHALGGTHGGVIATILDSAAWFTAATRYDKWIATSDLHIQLIRPVTKSGMTARGTLVKAGKNISYATMEARDDSGKLVAIGSATFALTSQKLTVSD